MSPLMRENVKVARAGFCAQAGVLVSAFLLLLIDGVCRPEPRLRASRHRHGYHSSRHYQHRSLLEKTQIRMQEPGGEKWPSGFLRIRGGVDYDHKQSLEAHMAGQRPGGKGPAPPLYTTPPRSNKQFIEEGWTALHESSDGDTCSEDWVDLNALHRSPSELQKLANASNERRTKRRQKKALLDLKRLNTTPIYYRFEGNRTNARSKGNMTVTFNYSKWDQLTVSSSDSGDKLIPQEPRSSKTAGSGMSRALQIQEIARQGRLDCLTRCKAIEDRFMERRLNSGAQDGARGPTPPQADAPTDGGTKKDWECNLCQHKNPWSATVCTKCELARDEGDPATQQPWTAAEEKNLRRIREMRRLIEKLETPHTCAKAESQAKMLYKYAVQLDMLEADCLSSGGVNRAR
mmetsp:Transcript_22543/g.43883  ORF Transcript_22543/g.43883 Transcript_22543/m.43883 type:complete len:403 (-) Transcript_22543:136-1344(-)